MVTDDEIDDDDNDDDAIDIEAKPKSGFAAEAIDDADEDTCKVFTNVSTALASSVFI